MNMQQSSQCTQSSPSIYIEDWSDSFTIIVEQDGVTKRFGFDQEEKRERLVELFHVLGFQNVTYSEVY